VSNQYWWKMQQSSMVIATTAHINDREQIWIKPINSNRWNGYTTYFSHKISWLKRRRICWNPETTHNMFMRHPTTNVNLTEAVVRVDLPSEWDESNAHIERMRSRIGQSRLRTYELREATKDIISWIRLIDTGRHTSWREIAPAIEVIFVGDVTWLKQ